MIKLTRPLVVLDTETTGTWPRTVDRIVQVALVRIVPEGDIEKWVSLVNPTIPIPPEATAIHGITDEMVKDAPTFSDLHPEVSLKLTGCDVAGFSVGFDMTFLDAEYLRCGRNLPSIGAVLDIQDIYRRYNPRSLSDAVRQYLGKELTGAHDALADAWATSELLWQMMVKHPELPDTIEGLQAEFSKKVDPSEVDPDGKLYWRNREACMNFSDYAGLPLKEVPASFLRWVLNKDFPEPFKIIVRDALRGIYPVKP